MPRKRGYRRRGKRGKACHVSKCVKKYVHKAITKLPELKYNNINYNGLYCARTQGTTGAYFCLTDNITKGTADINNRIGDQITLNSLEMRVFVGVQAASADAANAFPSMRLILFQFHDTVDTEAKIGSALDALLPIVNILNVGAGNVISPTSPIDTDAVRAKQFTILYDSFFPLEKSVLATYASGKNERCITIKRKFRNKLYYIGSSDTYCKNHVFCLCMSNATYDNTVNPLLYMASQIKYSDA